MSTRTWSDRRGRRIVRITARTGGAADPAALDDAVPVRARPLRVGLTGNIGSGKSTVARLLADHGAAVIDADALARAATDDPDVLARIAASLGDGLVAGGRLDRAATAARVFGDPAALARLNAIVHPWVRARSAERERELLEAVPPPPVIVHDVPLLYENGLDAAMDAVIVVDAPLETRLRRVAERSGASIDDLRARDAAQLPIEEKVARADFVVGNAGDLQELRAAVEALWAKLLARHQAIRELP
ncbi:MAG: dephospho-CoA kinase [Trueperaceae bacterium]